MAGNGETNGGALLYTGEEDGTRTDEKAGTADTRPATPPHDGAEQVPGRPDLVGEAARLATIGAYERGGDPIGWGEEGTIRPVDEAASDYGMGI